MQLTQSAIEISLISGGSVENENSNLVLQRFAALAESNANRKKYRHLIYASL